jgi:hypothetical protein
LLKNKYKTTEVTEKNRGNKEEANIFPSAFSASSPRPFRFISLVIKKQIQNHRGNRENSNFFPLLFVICSYSGNDENKNHPCILWLIIPESIKFAA